MFSSGQIVRFKQWDDMELEYGLTWNGDIHCEAIFTKKMRPLCGEIVTIEEVYRNSIRLTFESDERVKQLTGQFWTFSHDMFEPIEAEEISVDNVSGFWE